MLSYWKCGCMLLLLLAGCMTTETHMVLSDNLIPLQRLPVKQGEYESLVWLDNDQLVTRYTYANIDNFSSYHLGVLDLTETIIKPLGLPAHNKCNDLPYSTFLPVMTPDQRLAYMSSCVKSLAEGFREYVMVYDPASETATALRADEFNPITATGATGSIRSYSFFPNMQTGILVDSWTGARQLHTFDATSVTRVDLGVDGVGTAALSPDGSTLLITTQQGKKGIAMLDEPYQIELVDPTTWKRRPLFSGYNAASITWSPDSQHVAIDTNTANGEPYDLWVINAATGVRRRIAHGFYADIAWSLDGTTLAATRLVKPESVMNVDRDIVLLDLTQVELP